MFCTRCGRELQGESFCPNCGQPSNQNPVPVQPVIVYQNSFNLLDKIRSYGHQKLVNTCTFLALVISLIIRITATEIETEYNLFCSGRLYDSVGKRPNMDINHWWNPTAANIFPLE